jgi:hypothetical protein
MTTTRIPTSAMVKVPFTTKRKSPLKHLEEERPGPVLLEVE